MTGVFTISRWVDPDTNRRLWRMAGPMMLANIAVPLRGAVDTSMAGHLSEPYFLVAVAAGSTIFNFIFFAFNCLRMGTTAPTAQAFGAGNHAEVRAILWRALLLSSLISVSLLAMQLPIIDVALWMVPASIEAETHARTYFLIRIWGMPAALATYAFVGWLYGLEEARLPLFIQIVTNLINILLDFIFVFGFAWGVAGIAAAGLIADLAGLVIVVFVISRQLKRFKGITDWTLVLDVMRVVQMFVINRDIFLRTLCVISTTAIFIARSAGLGDLEAAANQILLNFVMFTSFGMDGIAFSAEALIGEAIGRRNLQQFRKVVRTVLVWTAILALLNVLIYSLFGLRIVYLMTDLEMVRRIAETYLIWSIMMPLVSSWAFSFDGIFIGATRTKTMRNTMFLAFAVFLSFVFGPFYELNNHFLWLAFFMFLTVRGGLLVAFYPRLQRSLERTGVS